MAEAPVYSDSREHAHMTHSHNAYYIVIQVPLNTPQRLPSSINVTNVHVTIGAIIVHVHK